MNSLLAKNTIALVALGVGIVFSCGSAMAENSMPSTAQVCQNSQCTVFQVAVKLKNPQAAKVEDSMGTIVIGGYSNPYSSRVEILGDSCTKEVRVPQPVYETIVQIMESMQGSNGEPPPALTPTQQTILLFYSTLMQQTVGFTCTQ
jgi:hypothetical protein